MKPIKIKKPQRMNKDGNAIVNILLFVTIPFLIVIFFVAWTFAHGVLTQELLAITTTNNINVSNTAAVTFGQIDAALPVLRWMSFGIIFALGISIFISNFLVRAHPVFFVVYFLIVIVAIVFAAILSNTYEALLLDTSSPLHSTFVKFVGANFVYLNLPVIVTVIGLVGGILLFIGIQRDAGQGGSIV